MIAGCLFYNAGTWRTSRGRAHCGFTLLEMLVTAALGVLIIFLVMVGFVAVRKDVRRHQLNQALQDDLRAVTEFIASDMRGVGVNIQGVFPYLEIADGMSGPDNADRLILRSSPVQTTLVVCNDPTLISGVDIQSGNPLGTIGAATVPDCLFGRPATAQAQVEIANQIAIDGGPTLAYIFDGGLRVGEAFRIQSTDLNAVTEFFTLQLSAPLSGSYATTGGRTTTRLISQTEYRLNAGVLERIINNNPAVPQRIMGEIKSFSVVAHLVDALNNPITLTNVGTNIDWPRLRSIEVAVTGERPSPDAGSLPIRAQLATRLFPRNVPVR